MLCLRDTSLPGIRADDGRHVEILATGLPLHRGVPLAIDATLVSPLHADGSPWDHAATQDGIAISRAEQVKASTYPELVDSPVVRLVTVACEVGGRWNAESQSTLRSLAAGRARAAPPLLRHAARASWLLRWRTLVSVAQQDCLAASLVDDVPIDLDGVDGEPPCDVSVWSLAAR